jgi:aspartate/methionine/tyrosine aminotransferase
VLPAIRYLDFAVRWFGRVRYDLATSGLTPISAGELGRAVPDDPEARERFIAAVAERYGVSEAEVVPTLGTSGALFVAYATVLERNGAVLVEEPGYEPLIRVAEGLGARVDRFQRERGDLEPARVLRALEADTRLVAITNPHNPTAILLEDAQIRELSEVLETRGVALLVDEAYLESVAPRRSARRLGPNVMSCSSATKSWGVPWARAGWLLMPKETAALAIRAERHAVGNAPPSSFAWGELALKEAERLLERASLIQLGKRELVERFAAAHAERLRFSPPPPGSLFGWLEDVRGRRLTPLIERGIEASGVIVSPGEFFGAPSGCRISWTTDSPALERGLELLPEALEL